MGADNRLCSRCGEPALIRRGPRRCAACASSPRLCDCGAPADSSGGKRLCATCRGRCVFCGEDRNESLGLRRCRSCHNAEGRRFGKQQTELRRRVRRCSVCQAPSATVKCGRCSRLCCGCGVRDRSSGQSRCADCLRVKARSAYRKRAGTANVLVVSSCRECGRGIEPNAGSTVVSTHRKWCGDACRDRVKRRRRRALKIGAEHREYSAVAIFDRDGWRCGICRGMIDRNAPARSRMSASLDHIVPLSRGGSDAAENIQAAHLSCNSRKSNRG